MGGKGEKEGACLSGRLLSMGGKRALRSGDDKKGEDVRD